MQQEEASLSSIEEELSLLDEEFEDFKEELFSLENDLQKKEPVSIFDEIKANQKTIENEVIAEHVEAQDPNETSVATSAIDRQPEPKKMDFASENGQSQHMEFMPVSNVDAPRDNASEEFPAIMNVQGSSLIAEPNFKNTPVSVDLNHAFAGSPIIYSVLSLMSISALAIWLYSFVSIQRSARLSGTLLRNVQNKLSSNQFEEALSLCIEQDNLFCKMISSGIQSRRHGLPVMIEAMKAEGKRASTSFWQKLGLLNDIAIIAPMIGLLGTVMGMFYAFYDINRSIESISTLFDGLGVSVGTTVAGLIVAILALILQSTAKYRLVRTLSQVENEAQNIATLIDDRTSIYKG
jgi:biopolymer transport protein ExbB